MYNQEIHSWPALYPVRPMYSRTAHSNNVSQLVMRPILTCSRMELPVPHLAAPDSILWILPLFHGAYTSAYSLWRRFWILQAAIMTVRLLARSQLEPMVCSWAATNRASQAARSLARIMLNSITAGIISPLRNKLATLSLGLPTIVLTRRSSPLLQLKRICAHLSALQLIWYMTQNA